MTSATPTTTPDIRLGITPTCWTNDDFPLMGDDIAFEQSLSEIAFAGFQGCSIGHKFPKTVRELAAALELRDLSITEPWTSTFFTVPDGEDRTYREFQERLDFLSKLNDFADAGKLRVRCDTIGVAEFGNSVHLQTLSLKSNRRTFSKEQWDALGTGLNALGELAAERDFKVAYHPHMGTGVQTQEELVTLMQNTDERYVHLLLDVGHLTWAGGNPVEVIEGDHGHRIKHVHLKNIRRDVFNRPSMAAGSFRDYVEAGIFTVPGDKEGMVDFPSIINALKRRNYQGWLVVEAEQEFQRDGLQPLHYARLARGYLAELGVGAEYTGRPYSELVGLQPCE
ncbi:myo-inosose-2 dehydratase [Streptomyces marianii]|uniref:Myo-inosose-2 dehydratase n=1 Tax=Streptomyces marianii TaxID=1817406 RepID=A0A5R9E6S4_9ACTN|nr:myo-inosose-2 dehydratase [Streptomyces marianii]TLQ44589.1 myo-inosose-2 dehydratase [Streptomyces marianii]